MIDQLKMINKDMNLPQFEVITNPDLDAKFEYNFNSNTRIAELTFQSEDIEQALFTYAFFTHIRYCMENVVDDGHYDTLNEAGMGMVTTSRNFAELFSLKYNDNERYGLVHDLEVFDM